MPLPRQAEDLLNELVGPGNPRRDAPLEKLIERVPRSKLPETDVRISIREEDRVSHSHGQSLPDWAAMRFGTLNRFPDAVAYPESETEIEDVLDFADKHEMTVIPYGGGTSVVGHLDVPDTDAPVLSLSLARLNQLIELQPENRLASFGAGTRGPDLEAALRARGYTLGHYPQSFDYSTLGGWVVTRSSGQQSRYYGRIEDQFASGTLITPRGRVVFAPHPASAAGPDLRHLLLGSEGRLGVLAKASVRIRQVPEKDDVHGVFFPTWDAAVCAVRELAAADLPLSMIRLSNPRETMTNFMLAWHESQIGMLKRYLRMRGFYDEAYCMALIGFIGPGRMVSAGKRIARRIIGKYKGVSVGKPMGNAWKKNRFRAPYLRNTLWDKGYAVDTLETAVVWERVTPTMKAVEKAISEALHSINEKVHVFTHLSHVYPTGSSIYTTYLFRLADTAEETLERWHKIKSAASDQIVRAGGTISHQHGVGTDHRQYLKSEKGELGIEMLQTVFEKIDPGQRMNPGKLI